MGIKFSAPAAKLEPVKVIVPVVAKVSAVGQKRGPKLTGKAKERITLYVDPDVLAIYRSTGDGWQSRLNSDLRKAVGL